MKTFSAIKTGLVRSVKAWKGVLIVWFFYLLFVWLLVIPISSSMKAGFGSSTITDKLAGGFNIEVFSDLDQVAKSILRAFSSGLFLALVVGIILNAFLSGGLFSSLKADSGKFRVSEFFGASGRYFWKYLLISLIISFILLLLGIFILFAPIGLVAQSDPDSERIMLITGLISGIVYLFFVMILLSVADYARAWNAARENPLCFKSIGFGLSRTFERFRSSFTLILIIILIQILFTSLVVFLIGTWRPATGAGVFLIFLTSQILFIIRLFIKTWRYGGITNLMELNDKTAPAEVIYNNSNMLNNEKTDNN